MTTDVVKKLGSGTYWARRAADSNLVTLTASGVMPCFNWQAELVQRPERIFPPQWSLVFWTTPLCLTAMKPFLLQVHVSIPEGAADRLIVHDASGKVEVPIEAAVESKSAREAGIALDLFTVQALLPASRPARGCIVVPYGTILPAIYYRAHGPAPRLACENWVAQNCGAVTASAEAEPWPDGTET